MLRDQSELLNALLHHLSHGAPAGVIRQTFLATCHLPKFFRALHCHAEQVDRNSLIILKSKDTSGSWKTSAAKGYPPRLNQGLAHAFVQACQVALTSQTCASIVPPSFDVHFKELCAGDLNMAEQVMQPDYALVGRQQRLGASD